LSPCGPGADRRAADDWPGDTCGVIEEDRNISLEELQLAARNHGMPLEALREPVTPIGLHYLLIHYDIPHVDPATWRLSVDGRVTNELLLDLTELRALPSHEVVATMECAGNGRAHLAPRPVSQPWLLEAVGTGRWRGARLRDVLEPAGAQPDTVEVLFTGLDRGIESGETQSFQRSLLLAEALGDDVLLAYELNGVPLPPQHGYPLRLLVPGWYGMTNVKWLTRITVLDTPFTGYQQARGYRLRQTDDEPGEPLSRILPRALMVPPGIPDFMTRDRTMPLAPARIEGRAWSGLAPISAVDCSTDGGVTWQSARLEPSTLGPWAWRGWGFDWAPRRPGRYVVSCRARDEAGNEQPSEQVWNAGGYANNDIQRVSVTVE
jgi:sulfane dehydrogenase subunit SoxC